MERGNRVDRRKPAGRLGRWGIPWRTATAWLAAAGIAYFLYLSLVDIPMYWSRWVVDEAAGKRYLSLGQGLLNAAMPPAVSYGWDTWKSEMGWMAAYFSLAVWVSIWLVLAPVPRATRLPHRQRMRTPLAIPGTASGRLAWRMRP